MKAKLIFSIFTSILMSCLGAAAVTSAIPALPFEGTAAVLLLTGIFVNTFSNGVLLGILNPSDLTFNGEEVKSLSEAIQEAVYSKPALTQFHTPYTGIKARKQIALLGRLNGLVGKKHVQSGGEVTCAPTANTAGITNSEKFWTPAYIEDRFAECWDNLLETFFIYGTMNGVEKADLTKTEFADFLIGRIDDELYEAVLRFVWFGDVDAAAYDVSPAGNFISGITPASWNAIDGLWKQLFTIAAGTPARRVTIARNAQATFALQAFTTTDTTNLVVTNMLQSLIFSADFRLREKADKIIIVTQSVADQYVKELESGSSNGQPVSFEYIQNGISKLSRMGVTIYAFSFWDRMIQGYTRNSTGLGWDNPHRALLSVKSNIAVGTEEVSNLAELLPFYDQTLKQFFVDLGFNLDAKILEDYLIEVAY